MKTANIILYIALFSVLALAGFYILILFAIVFTPFYLTTIGILRTRNIIARKYFSAVSLIKTGINNVYYKKNYSK